MKVWTQGVACFVIKGSDIRVSAFCNDAARGYQFRMKEHMGDDTYGFTCFVTRTQVVTDFI